MTKEQFDKMYVGEKLAVHCDTEEKANEFLKLADSFGYKWCDGGSYLTENEYDSYGEDTCYYISHGFLCDLAFYKNIGYKIVKYDSVKNAIVDELIANAAHHIWGIPKRFLVSTTNTPSPIYHSMKFSLDEIVPIIPFKIVFNEEKGRTTLLFGDKNNPVVYTSQVHKDDKFSERLGFIIAMLKRFNYQYIDMAFKRYGNGLDLITHLESILFTYLIEELSLTASYKLMDNLYKDEIRIKDDVIEIVRKPKNVVPLMSTNMIVDEEGFLKCEEPIIKEYGEANGNDGKIIENSIKREESENIEFGWLSDKDEEKLDRIEKKEGK